MSGSINPPADAGQGGQLTPAALPAVSNTAPPMQTITDTSGQTHQFPVDAQPSDIVAALASIKTAPANQFITDDKGQVHTFPSDAQPSDIQAALSSVNAKPVTQTIADTQGQTHSFPADAGPADVQQALASVNRTPVDTTPATLSYSSDVRGGLSDAMTGAGQTSATLGGVLDRNGLPSVGGYLDSAGKWLTTNAPAQPAGQSSGAQLNAAVGNLDWRTALTTLPHAVLRGLIGAAPTIGAGLALGPEAALGVGTLQGLGPEAYERAANNGRSTPNDTDALLALPGAVGQGLGAAIMPGVSGLVEGALGKAGARIGGDLVGNALGSAAGQVGGSLGTDQGLSVSPAAVGGAALTGAGIGGVVSGVPLVRAGMQAGGQRLMELTQAMPQSVEEAQSIVRWNGYLQDAQQDPNAQGQSATVVSKNVKDALQASAQSFVQTARAAGADSGDVAQLNVLIRQAATHNNVVKAEDIAQVGQLGLPVSSDALSGFQRDLMDLQTASTQGFANRGVGPFQWAASKAATAAAVLGFAAHGAFGDAALAALGHGTVSRTGAVVGNLIDRALGLNVPQAQLNLGNANRYLRANGIDPASVANRTGAYAPISSVTGNVTPDPIPVGVPVRPGTPAGRLAAAQAASRPPVFQPTTMADITQAVNADPSMRPSTAPASAPQTPAATPGAPQAPTASTGLLGAPMGLPVGSPAPTIPPTIEPSPLSPAGRLAAANRVTEGSVGVPQGVQQAPGRVGAQTASTPSTGVPTAPTSLSGPAAHPANPTWERLVAHGDVTLTRQDVRDAASAIYSPEQIAALDAQRSFANVDTIKSVVGPIQAEIAAQRGQSPPGGGAASGGGVMLDAQGNVIRSVPAYEGARETYQAHALELSRQAEQAIPGHGIGAAVLDVAATHGATKPLTVAAKVARTSEHLGKLAPHVRAQAAHFFTKSLTHGAKGGLNTTHGNRSGRIHSPK